MRTPFSSPNKAPPKGPYLMPHGGLRPTQPGSPNKTAKMMAAIKKLQDQNQITLTSGIVASSADIFQASQNAPTASTNLQLGITDATQEISEGTLFLLRHLAQNQALPTPSEPVPPMPIKGRIPTVRNPQWHAKGWVLKYQDVLTVDLPKVFDHERGDWGFRSISCDPAFRIRALDDSTDWRSRLFLPYLDVQDLPRFTSNPRKTAFRSDFACRTDHAFVSVPARDHLEPFLANASSPSPSDLGIDQDLLQGHIKFVKERRPNFVAAPDSAYNHMKDISNRESEGDISSGVEKRGDEDENMDYNDGGGEPWQGIQNVDSGDGGDADEGEEVAQSRTEMGKHKGRYDCKCRWAIEITFEQCDKGTCNIWQLGDHEAMPLPLCEKFLHMSPRINDFILRDAALLGSSPTGCHLSLLRAYKHNRFNESEMPLWRRPSPAQIKNVYDGYRRTRYLHNNPLMSVRYMHERNPDSFILYEPLDEEQQFAVGLSCPSALDTAILNVHNGVGLDSSWRHLNHSDCPLTLLHTTNDAGRMLPIALFLSQDTKATTLEKLLRAAKEAVEQRASTITFQGLSAHFAGYRSEKEISEIRANASTIDKVQWTPSFAMIDKDQAELNALEEVFSKTPVRICQFHMMQAVRRWVKAHGIPLDFEESVGEPDPPSLPRPAMDGLMKLIRPLQRVRSPANSFEWQTAVEKFNDGVRSLSVQHKMDEGTATKILSYFQENWFCDRWRKYWTDEGLPPGGTRDGPMNTNNHAESGFRTIKTLFLGGMKNKRVDQLVVVIINDVFPYFEMWPPTAPRPSKTLVGVMRSGHNLWQISHFELVVEDMGKQLWAIIRDSTGDDFVQENKAVGTVLPTVIKTLVEVHEDGSTKCPCQLWLQTGKYCGHLWALAWYFSCGSFLHYQDGLEAHKGHGRLRRAEKATSKSEAKSRSIAEKKFWEVGDLGEREYSEIGWPATGTVTRPRLTVHAPFPAPEVDNGPSRSNGTNRESPSPVVVPASHSSSSTAVTTCQDPRFALPINASKKGRNGYAIPIRSTRQPVQPKSKPHPQAGASPVGFNTCSAAREATSKAKGVKAAPSPAVFTIKQGQGLVNGVGRNICYLNAAFQALLHLPFIRNKLLETRVIRTTRSADFVKSLCELACQWEKAMEPFEVEWFLKHRLQDVVRGDNEPSTQEYLNDFDFPVNEQQCISEFFWNFFNKLRNEKHWLVDEFRISTSVEYRCLSCTDVKEGQTCESQTLEIGVPVKLKDTKTLKELVAALFTTSYQPHPTVVHGTSCCSATTIQVHTTIINTPRYILIHLDRSEERRLGDTVSRGVKICRELELGEYTGGKFPHLKYKLASTIRHRAFDEHSGHYMTDVMVGNAWRRFDDDKVSSVEDPFRHSACRSKKVGGQTVWQDSPVMLVYQIQEQSKGSKTAGTGGIDTHTDTDQLRSGTAFEVKGASSASTAEPGATAAPSSETSLPHWLKGYNFEASSSLPRLLESFDLANANAIETFKRLIAAPSETQKGYATFVKAGDIPGVGNGLIIPPQSASRFKPGAWADNHIMSVWTELLARFAPPSVYCLDGPFYESLGTRRGSALQVEKFHNKALFSTMPSYRRILFFVPFTNHWAVGVIDTAQRQVILLDSRGKAFNLAHFHERIRSFLLGVYTRELQATPLFTVPGHPLYEELPLSNDVTSYVPQQSDGNNCGYIATRYMELAVLGLHPTAVNCGLLGDQWSSHEGDQLRMDVWIKLVNLAPSTSLASTASDTPAPCTRGTSLAGSADEVLGKNKRRRQQKLSLRGGSRQTRDCTPDVVQVTPPTSPVNWNRFPSLSPVIVGRRADPALLRRIEAMEEADRRKEARRLERQQDPMIAPNGNRMMEEHRCRPAGSPTLALENDRDIQSLAARYIGNEICPLCDEHLPREMPEHLQRLLPLWEQAESSLLKMNISVDFCMGHRRETHIYPVGRLAGYPTAVDWDRFELRIRRNQANFIRRLMENPLGSEFYDRACIEIAYEGPRAWRSAAALNRNYWDRRDRLNPGYYGRRGKFLIFTTVINMMSTRGFRTAHRALQEPGATAPLSLDEWVEHVLVREVGLRLIMGDMEFNATMTTEDRRRRALRVMIQSAEYGFGLFP